MCKRRGVLKTVQLSAPLIQRYSTFALQHGETTESDISFPFRRTKHFLTYFLGIVKWAETKTTFKRKWFFSAQSESRTHEATWTVDLQSTPAPYGSTCACLPIGRHSHLSYQKSSFCSTFSSTFFAAMFEDLTFARSACTRLSNFNTMTRTFLNAFSRK